MLVLHQRTGLETQRAQNRDVQSAWPGRDEGDRRG